MMNVMRGDEVNTIENIGLMFWVCQMTALQVRVCLSLAPIVLGLPMRYRAESFASMKMCV